MNKNCSHGAAASVEPELSIPQKKKQKVTPFQLQGDVALQTRWNRHSAAPFLR